MLAIGVRRAVDCRCCSEAGVVFVPPTRSVTVLPFPKALPFHISVFRSAKSGLDQDGDESCWPLGAYIEILHFDLSFSHFSKKDTNSMWFNVAAAPALLSLESNSKNSNHQPQGEEVIHKCQPERSPLMASSLSWYDFKSLDLTEQRGASDLVQGSFRILCVFEQ